MSARPFSVVGCVILVCACVTNAGKAATQRTDSLRETARAVLNEVFRAETGWTKIHAGDALISVGEGRAACAETELDLPKSELPYRIGFLRILAEGARTSEARERWMKQIQDTFLRGTGISQATALESLCKLNWKPESSAISAIKTFAQSADEADGVVSWWALHLAGEATALNHIQQALTSTNDDTRLIAAYALRRIGVRRPEILAGLQEAASRETANSTGYGYILGTAFVLETDHERILFWRKQLEDLLDTGTATGKSEACQALMLVYEPKEIARFEPFLHYSDPEVRIAAARAVLYILRPEDPNLR